MTQSDRASAIEASSVPAARWTPPWVNLLLFVLTTGTTIWAGAHWSTGAEAPPEGFAEIARRGLPYSAALLAILFCHEMGHYVLARLHRVDATLPFFIPVPPPFLVGTMGAVIRIRSRFPTRIAALDIGAAGPIAGFLVALPLLFHGFAISPVVAVPPGALETAAASPLALLLEYLDGRSATGTGGYLIFGDSLITWLAARATHGPLAPGTDIQIGPVALAAWFGMLVTALNLIPVGQLDGGHVIYALFGRHAERVSRGASWALLALGLCVSWSWLVWWLLVRFVVGVGHPPAITDAPLPPARRAVAIASLVILVLTFVPLPIQV